MCSKESPDSGSGESHWGLIYCSILICFATLGLWLLTEKGRDYHLKTCSYSLKNTIKMNHSFAKSRLLGRQWSADLGTGQFMRKGCTGLEANAQQRRLLKTGEAAESSSAPTQTLGRSVHWGYWKAARQQGESPCTVFCVAMLLSGPIDDLLNLPQISPDHIVMWIATLLLLRCSSLSS